MTDFNDNGGVIRPENDSGMRAWCQVMYALHAFSAIGGLLTSASIIGSFLTGWPSIIAVVLNYVKRGETRGTYLESHFRWQIRTFWFAFLWFVVAGIVSAPLVLMLGLGIFTFFLAALIVAAWIVYRVVRGWLALRDRRTMYT